MEYNTVTIGHAILFDLGEIYLTPGAQQALYDAEETPLKYLELHQTGDWGELSEEDKAENEISLKHGFRILSAFTTSKSEKLWIITEADRSSTTILLPCEY
jgi:hypothetical protein